MQRELLTKSVHLYVAYSAEHVRPFPMNAMAAFLNLCVRDVRAALTMVFWIVLFITTLHVVMNVGNFPAQN